MRYPTTTFRLRGARRHRSVLAMGAAFALLSAAVAGCGLPEDESSASSKDGPFTIGVIELFQSPQNAVLEEGFRSVTDAEGAKLEVNNPDGDVGKENQFFQNYITQKVDFILSETQSPTGSLSAFKSAKDAGIPVICFNTCLAPDLQEEYTLAYVGSDDEDLGVQTATKADEYVQANLNGKASVLMLTCVTFDVCKSRQKGIESVLTAPDYEFVATQEAYLPDDAVKAANAMLTANPDTDIIIAQNEGAVIGAVKAVEARGLEDQVKVFGIDGNVEIGRMLGEPNGILQFTVAQDFHDQAVISAELAFEYLKNGTKPEPFRVFSESIPLERGDTEAIEDYVSALPTS